ncbi:MAG: hypothetical protein A2487_19320 [Candidatus Raymondbacteria bacterium RifOxyC12_full_50_8]|nr:MAG: hypothetical protein A2487_19320 [Candidatus Raymondbacteria bacterium RifOxyC12_full_50_8]
MHKNIKIIFAILICDLVGGLGCGARPPEGYGNGESLFEITNKSKDWVIDFRAADQNSNIAFTVSAHIKYPLTTYQTEMTMVVGVKLIDKVDKLVKLTKSAILAITDKDKEYEIVFLIPSTDEGGLGIDYSLVEEYDIQFSLKDGDDEIENMKIANPLGPITIIGNAFNAGNFPTFVEVVIANVMAGTEKATNTYGYNYEKYIVSETPQTDPIYCSDNPSENSNKEILLLCILKDNAGSYYFFDDDDRYGNIYSIIEYDGSGSNLVTLSRFNERIWGKEFDMSWSKISYKNNRELDNVFGSKISSTDFQEDVLPNNDRWSYKIDPITTTETIDGKTQFLLKGTARYKCVVTFDDNGNNLQTLSSKGKDDQFAGWGIDTAVTRVSVKLSASTLPQSSEIPYTMFSYYWTPWIYGSSSLVSGDNKTHQTEHYVGFDCADLVIGAVRHWKGLSNGRYNSSSSIVSDIFYTGAKYFGGFQQDVINMTQQEWEDNQCHKSFSHVVVFDSKDGNWIDPYTTSYYWDLATSKISYQKYNYQQNKWETINDAEIVWDNVSGVESGDIVVIGFIPKSSTDVFLESEISFYHTIVLGKCYTCSDQVGANNRFSFNDLISYCARYDKKDLSDFAVMTDVNYHSYLLRQTEITSSYQGFLFKIIEKK